MKLRGSFYFTAGITAVLLFVVISAWRMEYLDSKLLPLIFAGSALALAIIALLRELSTKNKPAPTVSEDSGKQEVRASGRSYLMAGSWALGFFIGIFLLGFVISIPVFLVFYLKTHGTKWLPTIICAVATVVIIYFFFNVALQAHLYSGYIFGGG